MEQDNSLVEGNKPQPAPVQPSAEKVAVAEEVIGLLGMITRRRADIQISSEDISVLARDKANPVLNTDAEFVRNNERRISVLEEVIRDNEDAIIKATARLIDLANIDNAECLAAVEIFEQRMNSDGNGTGISVARQFEVVFQNSASGASIDLKAVVDEILE